MLNLLFPKVCNGCEAKLLPYENILCAYCRHHIPLASYHKINDPFMKNLFLGRVDFENATALFRFEKKGITQQLIHQLKYKGQKQISAFLGKWLGEELKENNNYKDIDLVIPVPLHKKKLKIRGYNQVDGFGKEIAKALEVPFRDDILLKIINTKTQVFKERSSRFKNENIFEVSNASYIENKHILIVDDILTTGATLEKCALALQKVNQVKLSIATMAIA